MFFFFFFFFTDAEEEFYVLPEDRAQCTDELAAWREMLSMGEKLHPQLDRSPQVMLVSSDVAVW